MTQSTAVLFDLIKKVLYIIGYEVFFISKMKKKPDKFTMYTNP